jgi:CRISPR-associated endonuclease/helicase Cas3
LIEGNAIDQRQTPVLNILSPKIEDDPSSRWYSDLFPRAAAVYPHIGRLWLTARILAEKGDITMPEQLRELIESVYSASLETIPKDLQNASAEAEAEAMGKAGLGKYNGLDFERGYHIRSGEWSEEVNVPTRIGEETQTIYLAMLNNDRLVPLKDGQFPWDLSSLRLSREKLESISPAIREEFHGQLEELIQKEKRLSEFNLIVPLKNIERHRWISEGTSGNGNLVDILYDENIGMMVGDEIKGS